LLQSFRFAQDRLDDLTAPEQSFIGLGFQGLVFHEVQELVAKLGDSR
jgi:hypothetical protein